MKMKTIKKTKKTMAASSTIITKKKNKKITKRKTPMTILNMNQMKYLEI